MTATTMRDLSEEAADRLVKITIWLAAIALAVAFCVEANGQAIESPETIGRGTLAPAVDVPDHQRSWFGPRELTEVRQHGIRWTFAETEIGGRYANGDWWVLGPVDIVEIDPPSVEAGGRTRNGSQLNPNPRTKAQGYDSSTMSTTYRADLNVARGVSRSRPLHIATGSLISTISVDDAAQKPQLRRAAVLSVIREDPGDWAFRPPYSSTDKSSPGDARLLRWWMLRRLQPPEGTVPGVLELAESFERVWIDHYPSWAGWYLHPADNMPGYGRELATAAGDAGLMLHMDVDLHEKALLAIRYVQTGIDLWGVWREGGVWYHDGGHASGRKWPILLAGILLHHPDMLDVGRRGGLFGEDDQTFYVAETSPGVINYGHGGYTRADIGLPEWGIRHRFKPQDDRKNWNEPYRVCCTANAWTGFVLAARMTDGAVALWNHPALFDYVDRYVTVPGMPGWQYHWSGWARRCWERYRDVF